MSENKLFVIVVIVIVNIKTSLHQLEGAVHQLSTS